MNKEKEFSFNYIWVSAEIGEMKRKIREYERLLKILEETKKQMEDKINRKRKEKRR